MNNLIAKKFMAKNNTNSLFEFVLFVLGVP